MKTTWFFKEWTTGKNYIVKEPNNQLINNFGANLAWKSKQADKLEEQQSKQPFKSLVSMKPRMRCRKK